MPHVLVCRYQPWASGAERIPDNVGLALLEKHMMLRIVCPWDVESGAPLKVCDIAIVTNDAPEAKINAELVRLRAAGVRAERIPFLALMGDIRTS